VASIFISANSTSSQYVVYLTYFAQLTPPARLMWYCKSRH